MQLEYIKVEKQPKGPFQCPHNEGCACKRKECHKCGWNPKVAKARAERVRKEALENGQQL